MCVQKLCSLRIVLGCLVLVVAFGAAAPANAGEPPPESFGLSVGVRGSIGLSGFTGRDVREELETLGASGRRGVGLASTFYVRRPFTDRLSLESTYGVRRSAAHYSYSAELQGEEEGNEFDVSGDVALTTFELGIGGVFLFPAGPGDITARMTAPIRFFGGPLVREEAYTWEGSSVEQTERVYADRPVSLAIEGAVGYRVAIRKIRLDIAVGYSRGLTSPFVFPRWERFTPDAFEFVVGVDVPL